MHVHVRYTVMAKSYRTHLKMYEISWIILKFCCLRQLGYAWSIFVIFYVVYCRKQKQTV